MKMDLSDITLLLDRSGSMQNVKSDTIGGFNAFLEEQKAVPGDARFSLIQFDDRYEVVHTAMPLAFVPALTNTTYQPRGMTALLDAIGKTIVATGERLAAMPEAERPGRVLLIIMTDGLENASREYRRDDIFKMITIQRTDFNWQIAFVGADQDAVATGRDLGIPAANTLSYASTGEGTRQVLTAGIGGATKAYRTSPTPARGGFFTGEPQEKTLDPDKKTPK